VQALPSPRTSARVDELTGHQKAAVLLMALGPQESAAITASLSAEQLESITYEIARMDRITPELADAVIAEWRQMEAAAHNVRRGGIEFARAVLEQAVGPQKAGPMLARIESQLNESIGFTNLRAAEPEQIAKLVEHEHPQTIALLLSHLDYPQAAGVLGQLEAELSATVIYRMARMDKVMPEVLQLLEQTFAADTQMTLTKEMSSAGGPKAVAAVLNLLPARERELLDGMAREDAALSEQIRDLMFVFEDIAKLDDKAVQRLLREVQTRDLALALKGASDGLRKRIMSLLPTRAANGLLEEMDLLGPVRVRDVEQAQAGVVKLIRALQEAGEIEIGGGDDDLVV
jgi:flagellar motor switch protein FliG